MCCLIVFPQSLPPFPISLVKQKRDHHLGSTSVLLEGGPGTGARRHGTGRVYLVRGQR